MQVPVQAKHLIKRHRFILLFAVLVFFFVLIPLLHHLREAVYPAMPPLLEGILFILVLAAVMISVSESRRGHFFTLALGVPAALLGLMHLAAPSDLVDLMHHLFAAGFLSSAMMVILRYLFVNQRVTLDMVFASLCVYLLLGVLWALAYSALSILNPAAFYSTLPGNAAPVLRIGQGGKAAVLYFSFSTLTTLGYGDIVPVSPLARMLTSVEAITGQLYLTVLVARLVGLHITESLSQRS